MKKEGEKTDQVSINDTFTLNKQWMFHYKTPPYEVMWKQGAVFRVVAFSTLVDDRVILDLQDENGRHILIDQELMPLMFEKRQMQMQLPIENGE